MYFLCPGTMKTLDRHDLMNESICIMPIDGDMSDCKEMVEKVVKNEDQEETVNSKLICLPCRDNKEENRRTQFDKKTYIQECQSIPRDHQKKPIRCDKTMRNSTRHRILKSPCVICLSEYTEGDGICWSPNSDCQHVYHNNCLLSWFTRQTRTISWRNNVHGIHNVRLEEIMLSLQCPICKLKYL